MRLCSLSGGVFSFSFSQKFQVLDLTATKDRSTIKLSSHCSSTAGERRREQRRGSNLSVAPGAGQRAAQRTPRDTREDIRVRPPHNTWYYSGPQYCRIIAGSFCGKYRARVQIAEIRAALVSFPFWVKIRNSPTEAAPCDAFVVSGGIIE